MQTTQLASHDIKMPLLSWVENSKFKILHQLGY